MCVQIIPELPKTFVNMKIQNDDMHTKPLLFIT